MKKFFVVFAFVFVAHAKEAPVESFLNYCQNSETEAKVHNLIKQLKFNYSTPNCEKILAKINRSKRVFVYCQRECDVKALSEFDHIRALEIVNGQMGDITPISKMTSLKKINFYKNRISDLSSVGPLTKLEQLSLRENRCHNIDHLASLKRLRELDLGSNRIEDISSLSTLTNLRILDLSNNKIRDISPLTKLSNLLSVELGSNPIIKSRKNCPYGRGVPRVISEFCRRYLRRG